MSDLMIVQKGDLNPSVFANNNTQNQGGIGLRLSGEQGNLLSARPDGLYYGTIAPADVRVQFVDAVNGNDNNAGAIDNPLKTINHAIQRLPVGTLDNVIYIKEQQIHDVEYSLWVNASFRLEGYGPNTDAVEAVWNTLATGWTSRAAVEYEPYRPTVRFTYHFSPVNLAGITAMSWWLRGGAKVVFLGINIQVPNPISPTGNNLSWRGIIWGDGYVELQECKVFNGNSGETTWHLIDTHDSDLNVFVRNCDLESNDPLHFVFHIGEFLTANFDDRITSRSHPSGLTWRATTPKEVWKASVNGAKPPQLVSPNYHTNF